MHDFLSNFKIFFLKMSTFRKVSNTVIEIENGGNTEQIDYGSPRFIELLDELKRTRDVDKKEVVEFIVEALELQKQDDDLKGSNMLALDFLLEVNFKPLSIEYFLKFYDYARCILGAYKPSTDLSDSNSHKKFNIILKMLSKLEISHKAQLKYFIEKGVYQVLHLNLMRSIKQYFSSNSEMNETLEETMNSCVHLLFKLSIQATIHLREAISENFDKIFLSIVDDFIKGKSYLTGNLGKKIVFGCLLCLFNTVSSSSEFLNKFNSDRITHLANLSVELLKLKYKEFDLFEVRIALKRFICVNKFLNGENSLLENLNNYLESNENDEFKSLRESYRFKHFDLVLQKTIEDEHVDNDGTVCKIERYSTLTDEYVENIIKSIQNDQIDFYQIEYFKSLLNSLIEGLQFDKKNVEIRSYFKKVVLIVINGLNLDYDHWQVVFNCNCDYIRALAGFVSDNENEEDKDERLCELVCVFIFRLFVYKLRIEEFAKKEGFRLKMDEFYDFEMNFPRNKLIDFFSLFVKDFFKTEDNYEKLTEVLLSVFLFNYNKNDRISAPECCLVPIEVFTIILTFVEKFNGYSANLLRRTINIILNKVLTLDDDDDDDYFKLNKRLKEVNYEFGMKLNSSFHQYSIINNQDLLSKWKHIETKFKSTETVDLLEIFYAIFNHSLNK